MSDFDHDLERELHAAAPQARPLFVDEVARRLHAQRPGRRPTRGRLSLALAFSALTVAALGVLGAPGLVAHAANALMDTATFSAGSPAPSQPTSGSSQYEAEVPICHRTNTDPLHPTWVLIVDKPSNHDGQADIIPAPPWGCPGNERPHRPGDPSATTTTVSVSDVGPGNAAIPKTFAITVTAADLSRPSGSVLCFDKLVQFASATLVDGKAMCILRPRPAGTHSITAMFRTGDYKKWASSAGNVLTFSVGKGPSSLSVQTSRTPAPFGAGVTLTAVVTGPAGAPTPTGTVQFSDGASALGTAVALSTAGVATVTTSTLALGTHAITAAYGGDPIYDPSSAPLSQTITTAPVPPRPVVLSSATTSSYLDPPAQADVQSETSAPQDQTQQQAPSTSHPTPLSPTAIAKPAKAGAVAVVPNNDGASPTWVAWRPATFRAPATVTATFAAPRKAAGIQFAAGSGVIEVDAVTDAGQQITRLGDALDIAIPNVPAGVAPMSQSADGPWGLISRLGGTTLPAGQPDGWYLDGTTLHILTRHLSQFGLATALEVRWGTRRRVHLEWARRIVVYGAPNVEARATYTLHRGNRVYGTWTRTLPPGKGAPANLWLTGKHVVPGNYLLTIAVQAGPQRWTQVVAIRYLR